MRNKDLTKWAEKACLRPKKNERSGVENSPRERFLATRQASGMTIGVDGIRAHIVIDNNGAKDESAQKDLDVVLGLASRPKTAGRISKKHFLRACELAKAYNTRAIVVKFNETLVAEVKNLELGDADLELENGDEWAEYKQHPKYRRAKFPVYKPSRVVYEKTGPDVQAIFNPQYVADALSGMGEVAEFAISKDVLVLKSDSAQAVIMARRT